MFDNLTAIIACAAIITNHMNISSGFGGAVSKSHFEYNLSLSRTFLP